MSSYTIEEVQADIDKMEGDNSVSLLEVIDKYPYKINPDGNNEIRFFRNYSELFGISINSVDHKDKKAELTKRLYTMIDDVAYPKMDIKDTLDYPYNLLARTIDGKDEFIISTTDIRDIGFYAARCRVKGNYSWVLFIDTERPKVAIMGL